MRKYVEIRPIVLREYSMIAEKAAARANELQAMGYKVLSVSHSSFANTTTFLYRKTVWKAFTDWLTKPLEHWSI